MLDTLCTMNEVRPFRLVFLLEVPYPYQEISRRWLAETLDSLTARGSFGFLNSPPTVRLRAVFPQWTGNIRP